MSKSFTVLDVGHLGLGLTTNRNRHDIQASRYRLSMIVTDFQGKTTRPSTNQLTNPPAPRNLDTNLNRFAQLEGDRSLGLERSRPIGENRLWLTGQVLLQQLG